MNPDELRDRLAGIDPARDVETESVTTPSSRARLERIMQTRTEETTSTTPTTHRNRWIGAVAAAAAAVAIVGGIVATTGDGDTTTQAGPALELDLGASDAMASCLAPSAEFLADMPVAFAGTATEVEGETVTLMVTEWYAGGDDESTVVLHAASGMEALIDGFAFEEGTDYLVSATEGTVNFCGFSGPATPELQAMYDEAFAS